MKISRSALLRACLFASVPIATFAQTEPVIFEAEDLTIATLGSTMTIGSDGTTTYVTTTLNDTDRKSTRLNSSHNGQSRMPSSA